MNDLIRRQTIQAWQDEITAWASEKGWSSPQCSHAAFEQLPVSSRSAVEILWCRDCGAVAPRGSSEWRLPQIAKVKNFGEVCTLFVTEVSEAFEEWRSHRDVTEIYYATDKDGIPKPEGIPIEIADLMIRILHFCGEHAIDIEAVIDLKQRYNKLRPFRHGGKRA